MLAVETTKQLAAGAMQQTHADRICLGLRALNERTNLARGVAWPHSWKHVSVSAKMECPTTAENRLRKGTTDESVSAPPLRPIAASNSASV